MTKLTWITVKRKPIDLVKYKFNPRTITASAKENLLESLDQFNLVEIPVINHDNSIIAGNQRLELLIEVGRGQEDIDVRIPNRQLTEVELKKYMLISNTHAGEFDPIILEAEFKDIEILFPVIFEEPKAKKNHTDVSTVKDKGIIKMTFTNDNFLRIKEALNKLQITPEAIMLKFLFGE
jgi:hypothetical protein